MYYEINVTFNGQHFFATAPRSLTNERDAFSAYQTFKKKFKKAEGYSITVGHYWTIGSEVDFN